MILYDMSSKRVCYDITIQGKGGGDACLISNYDLAAPLSTKQNTTPHRLDLR